MDPNRQDRKRTMQGREVHVTANEQWSDGAPRTDVPKQQGKEARHGAKKVGKCEKAQKAVKNALEKELIAEMYEMTL